jgi:hypothetical protein
MRSSSSPRAPAGTFLMTPPTEARMRVAMDPAAHLDFRHGNKQNSKVLL